MPRGLIRGEDPVDVATQGRSLYEGRGLIRGERVRKRFIYPRRYWGNPQDPTFPPPTGFVTYPTIGGGYGPT
jgi:hypothetical protein